MAIKSVHLPDGTNVVFDEWLHWGLYSTIDVGSTGTNSDGVNLRAFTYVVGQRVPRTATPAARVGTTSDTNQNAKTRMNHDEAFLVYNITYEIFATTDVSTDASPPVVIAHAPLLQDANLRRLQRDIMIELFVGAGINKPQLRCPFSWVGQAIGPTAYTTGSSSAAGDVISTGTGGVVSPRNARLLKLPIYIESDRVMYMKIHAPTGTVTGFTQSVVWRWWLDGIKRRPIA
jgi:hypothetical protein